MNALGFRSAYRTTTHALVAFAGAALAFIGPTVLGRSEALAATKQACLEAADGGQRLRDDGKLQSAKAAFLVCSDRSCPGPVVAQCTEWLGELAREIPSVVFKVVDSTGKELLDAQVSLDNEATSALVSAKATALDLGPHTARIVLQDGRKAEEKFLLRKGERDRIVVVTVAAAAPEAKAPREPEAAVSVVAPAASARAEGPNAAAGAQTRGFVFPALAWVGTGVFVLGGVGGVFLGLSAKSAAQADRDKGCAPFCDVSGKSAIETKLVVANVALIASAAGLGLAVVATILANSGDSDKRPAPTARRLTPQIAITPGAAAVGVAGVF